MVKTNKLSVFRIRNDRLKRLQLIYNLHQKGLTYKEISEYLNNRNLKTFRKNKSYTTKLIWMTVKNYKKRLLRNENSILEVREIIYVKPNKYNI